MLLDREHFENNGYLIARSLLSASDLGKVVGAFTEVANIPTDWDSFETVTYLKNQKRQTSAYDVFQGHETLLELAAKPQIINLIRNILGVNEVDLLEKMPFRIDVPEDMSQLAVWHQDHFYVGGDPRTITAWIPFQDVPFQLGCLSVMPGSHKQGPIEHDNIVLAKRHFPGKIFDQEVRMVEVSKGDVVFFDGCLLHSGGMNLGNRVRYSMQPRYVARSKTSASHMGRRIKL